MNLLLLSVAGFLLLGGWLLYNRLPARPAGPGPAGPNAVSRAVHVPAARGVAGEQGIARLSVLRSLLEYLDGEEETRLYSLLLGQLLTPGDADAGAICRAGDGRPVLLARIPKCGARADEALLGALRAAPEWLSRPVSEFRVERHRWLALRIRVGEEVDSVLLLLLRRPAAARSGRPELEHCTRLAREFTSLLEDIARERFNRRHVLYRERALIARELHDSLAQSLSYLKIQVARLEALARGDGAGSPVTPALHGASGVIRELDDNINLAYRQLRELITTFRLTMNGRRLGEALERSVEELENRSGLAFQIDNRLPEGIFTVAEEMQVLHIVREALSNTVRHSGARCVRVSLQRKRNGEVCIQVDDDGRGFPVRPEADPGHGLEIMRQRVQELNGKLHLERAPLGGARLRVCFHAARVPTAQGEGA